MHAAGGPIPPPASPGNRARCACLPRVRLWLSRVPRVVGHATQVTLRPLGDPLGRGPVKLRGTKQYGHGLFAGAACPKCKRHFKSCLRHFPKNGGVETFHIDRFRTNTGAGARQRRAFVAPVGHRHRSRTAPSLICLQDRQPDGLRGRIEPARTSARSQILTYFSDTWIEPPARKTTGATATCSFHGHRARPIRLGAESVILYVGELGGQAPCAGRRALGGRGRHRRAPCPAQDISRRSTGRASLGATASRDQRGAGRPGSAARSCARVRRSGSRSRRP